MLLLTTSLNYFFNYFAQVTERCFIIYSHFKKNVKLLLTLLWLNLDIEDVSPGAPNTQSATCLKGPQQY